MDARAAAGSDRREFDGRITLALYSATIDNKVVVKIGPGLWNPGTGWTLKASGTDYAVWEKAVAVDVPSLAIAPTGVSITSNGANSGGPVVSQGINLLPIKGTGIIR